MIGLAERILNDLSRAKLFLNFGKSQVGWALYLNGEFYKGEFGYGEAKAFFDRFAIIMPSAVHYLALRKGCSKDQAGMAQAIMKKCKLLDIPFKGVKSSVIAQKVHKGDAEDMRYHLEDDRKFFCQSEEAAMAMAVMVVVIEDEE